MKAKIKNPSRTPAPESLRHLMWDGKLVEITYDTETTGLDRHFSHIVGFAGVISTIRGEALRTDEVKVRVPPHVLITPEAAVIANLNPYEVHYDKQRDPPHIAAGKILESFRRAPRALWDALDEEQIIPNNNGEPETVRLYRIPMEEGHDKLFRLHQQGKYVSYRMDDKAVSEGGEAYRDADGTRWRRVAAPAITNGYNNSRADDAWLWMLSFMGGDPDFLATHLKFHQRFRLDLLQASKSVVALDTLGEGGFKVPRLPNGAPSLSLSRVMSENTRRAAPIRQLEAGVQMPDGALYDKAMAHGELFDAEATLGLKQYYRQQWPGVVRRLELNADGDHYRKFLTMGPDVAAHPVRCHVTQEYPALPEARMVMCVGINEHISEKVEALLAVSDPARPLDKVRFEGQPLHGLDTDAMARFLTQQKQTPDRLIRTIRLRKDPKVFEPEFGFNKGVAGTPEWHETNRQYLVAHPEIARTMVAAHAQISTPIKGAEAEAHVQPEQEIFTSISDLKHYEVTKPDGTKALLPQAVHMHASNQLSHARNIDRCLHRLTAPDPVEWREDADSIGEYADKVKKLQRDLLKYSGASHGDTYRLPPPLQNVPKSAEEARDHLWQVREWAMYRFNDYTTSYKVLNNYGHEVPFTELVDIRQPELERNLGPAGEWSIAFEQLNYSSEIIAGMFSHAGRIEWAKQHHEARGNKGAARLWGQWENFLDARARLRLHGPPQLDASQHPWPSGPQILSRIERLQRNYRDGQDLRASEGEVGLAEAFMSNREEAELNLNRLQGFVQQQLHDRPLRPKHLRLLGYDDAGWPIEKVKYNVQAHSDILVLDAPDRLLENPPTLPGSGSRALLLNAPENVDLTGALTQRATHLFLRGQESGQLYYAARPAIAHEVHPQRADAANLYDKTAALYTESGAVFPAPEKVVPVFTEAIVPVSTPMDASIQTLKVLRREHFYGVVSEVLGYREGLGLQDGLLLRATTQTPQPGPARLQLMDGERESGREIQVQVQACQTLTLAELEGRFTEGRKYEKLTKQWNSKAALPAAPTNAMTNEKAARYGFRGIADMAQQARQWFVDQAVDPQSPHAKVHLVDLAAERSPVLYFNPMARPVLQVDDAVLLAAQRQPAKLQKRRVNGPSGRSG